MIIIASFVKINLEREDQEQENVKNKVVNF